MTHCILELGLLVGEVLDLALEITPDVHASWVTIELGQWCGVGIWWAREDEGDDRRTGNERWGGDGHRCAGEYGSWNLN
jgi:hypothetical protein